MIANATILLLAPIAGFFTALWLLLLWLGDGRGSEAQVHDGFVSGDEGFIGPQETDEPFVPMPGHLKTREEMVVWMTKELPKRLQAYGE